MYGDQSGEFVCGYWGLKGQGQVRKLVKQQGRNEAIYLERYRPTLSSTTLLNGKINILIDLPESKLGQMLLSQTHIQSLFMCFRRDPEQSVWLIQCSDLSKGKKQLVNAAISLTSFFFYLISQKSLFCSLISQNSFVLLHSFNSFASLTHFHSFHKTHSYCYIRSQ